MSPSPQRRIGRSGRRQQESAASGENLRGMSRPRSLRLRRDPGVVRWRRAVITGSGVLIAVVVVVMTVGGLARLRLDTTVASFLPSNDATVSALHSEQVAFGSDPIAVLLTSNESAQLLSGNPLRSEIALESALSKLPDVAVVYGPGSTLNEITRSLQNVLIDISATRDALVAKATAASKAAGGDAAAQKAAGSTAVAQFDQHYVGLLAQGLRTGLPSISNTKLGTSVYLTSTGQAQPAFRWLVPDAQHVSILIRPQLGLSQTKTQALVRSVGDAVRAANLPISHSVVTGTPVIVAALGGDVRTELPILAAVSTAVVAIGFLLLRRRGRWWGRLLPLGVGLTATAVTLAAFGWAGVALSLGLLAFLPVILGVGTDYPIYALRQGRPGLIVATAGASAASLLAGALNPLPYVRDLGVALGTGLLLSAVLGVAVARILGPLDESPRPPGRLRRAAVARLRRSQRRWPEEPEVGRSPSLGGVAVAPAWAAVGARAAEAEAHRPRPRGQQRWREHRLVGAGVATVLVAAIGWAGLGSLQLNSDPQRLAAGLPALQQGVAAESVLGAGGELDIYVRAPDVLSPAMFTWFTQAQERLVLAHGDQLRPVVSPVSLLSWLGTTPSPDQVGAATSVLPTYLTSASIRVDRTAAIMAFGVPLGSFGSQAELIRSITANLPPLPAGATLSVTGLPAVGARTYDLLSGDRFLPNLGGIALFGAVLLAFGRNRRSAVLAVVSALVATGCGFAVLRATGTPLTPLTVALGSLTSAVGGEFTVMARAAAGERRQWATVAAAAATSMVGFVVLAFSRLALLRQFGLVLTGSILLALAVSWLVVSLDAVRTARDRVSPGVGVAESAAARPAVRPARQEALV